MADPFSNFNGFRLSEALELLGVKLLDTDFDTAFVDCLLDKSCWVPFELLGLCIGKRVKANFNTLLC